MKYEDSEEGEMEKSKKEIASEREGDRERREINRKEGKRRKRERETEHCAWWTKGSRELGLTMK